ncbi:MAG: hypothetical protein O3A20_08770 [Planctomycetota bacterium]|nr:hypothetical protein [Planctomycetota bacterium]
MLTALLLLLAPQELVVTESVQRELRLHSVSELVSTTGYFLQPWQFRMARGSTLPQTPFFQKVPLLDILFTDLQQTPRDTSKFESVHEIEEIASRFCQPRLDPRQERIQADEQGWLVCYLRPEQHEWLQRFIELQQTHERHWMAMVETDWYTISSKDLAKLKLTSSALLLDDAEQIERYKEVLIANSADRLSTPRVSSYPGQLAELSSLNQVSYVKEYKLEIVEPGRKEIADPVVDVIQEGITMTLRVLQTGDELYGLRLSCASAELERPIPTRRFKLSPAHPSEVEVAMPQVRTAKVDATVLVADGGGVLLVTSGLADDRNLVIMVRFNRVEAPDESPEELEPEDPFEGR